MAEVTSSVTCNCGTFNAVAGAKSDEFLVNQCGGCGKTVSAPNPAYDPMLAKYRSSVDEAVGEHKATIADLQAQLTAKDAQIHDAQNAATGKDDEIAALKEQLATAQREIEILKEQNAPPAPAEDATATEPVDGFGENGESTEDADDNPPDKTDG